MKAKIRQFNTENLPNSSPRMYRKPSRKTGLETMEASTKLQLQVSRLVSFQSYKLQSPPCKMLSGFFVPTAIYFRYIPNTPRSLSDKPARHPLSFIRLNHGSFHTTTTTSPIFLYHCRLWPRSFCPGSRHSHRRTNEFRCPTCVDA